MSKNFASNGVSMVMLGVTDIERSLALYRDQLGFSVAMQFPGFAILNAGGVQLVLSEPLGGQTEQKVGAMELVIAVENVKAAHANLIERGVSFSQAPREVNPTAWAANFDDPDGHHLSLYGPEGSA